MTATVKIVYCQITNDYWSKSALENIKRAAPYVDSAILVHDGISSEEVKNELSRLNTNLVEKPFNNNFPAFRQHYLDEARRIGATHVLVSDTDEVIDELFLSSLRSILMSCPTFNSFELYCHYDIPDSHLMDVDEIAREAPAGLDDKTNWWKQMVFTLEPDVHYSGAIEGGTYHEHLVCDDWRVIKLPKKYFFTQSKTAAEIWRNCARAVVINGGGLDVKEQNPMHRELKSLLTLTLSDWKTFEQYCKNGNIDQRIKDVFIKYKDASEHYWDSENRSVFKWYFEFLHPEENIQHLESHFNPEMYSDGTFSAVRKKYFEILGRDADIGGLLHYANEINEYKTSISDLNKIFRQSDEYVRNIVNTAFMDAASTPPTETEASVWRSIVRAANLNENTVLSLIRQATQVARQYLFRVAYCQMTYKRDIEDTVKNVEAAKPYVDECIVVHDDSLNDEDRQRLRTAGASVWYFKWNDNFPEMRNNYNDVARYLGCGWVIRSDPDEHFDEYFLKNVKNLIIHAMRSGCNMMCINSHDISPDDDNGKLLDTPTEVVSDYYKELCYQLTPDVRYDGVGQTKNLHEAMVGNFRAAKLPKEFFYRHIKSHSEIWAHSLRNLYVGGGGDNIGKLNPYYVELHNVCNKLGIKSWKELHKYIIAGNIDKELADLIKRHRNDFGHNYDSEARETFKYYYYVLHPEENTENLKVDVNDGGPVKRMYKNDTEEFVDTTYKEVLKREADQGGMENYAAMIDNGAVKREQLKEILMQSDEYKNMVKL
ncbi:MAG: DUF4214 domain-containing protein [Bacillati bacterium]